MRQKANNWRSRTAVLACLTLLPWMATAGPDGTAAWPTAHGRPDFRGTAAATDGGVWREKWNVRVKAPVDVPPVADDAQVYVFTRRATVVER